MKVYCDDDDGPRLIGRADVPANAWPVYRVPLFGAASIVVEAFAIGTVTHLPEGGGAPAVERALLAAPGRLVDLLRVGAVGVLGVRVRPKSRLARGAGADLTRKPLDEPSGCNSLRKVSGRRALLMRSKRVDASATRTAGDGHRLPLLPKPERMCMVTKPASALHTMSDMASLSACAGDRPRHRSRPVPRAMCASDAARRKTATAATTRKPQRSRGPQPSSMVVQLEKVYSSYRSRCYGRVTEPLVAPSPAPQRPPPLLPTCS